MGPCYFVPLCLTSNSMNWTGCVFPFLFMFVIFLKLHCFLGKLVVMRKGCWHYSLTGYALFLALLPSLVKEELQIWLHDTAIQLYYVTNYLLT